MHFLSGKSRALFAAFGLVAALVGSSRSACAEALKPVALAGVGYVSRTPASLDSVFSSKQLTAQDYIAKLRPPLSAITVSSPFGSRINPVANRRMFHKGVDYAAATGTPIHAAQDGTVKEMRRNGNFGFFVRMNHGHGIETVYGHMLKFMPGLHHGSVVRRGDVIGFVGETGWATGTHLHFEVLMNGKQIDPQRLAGGFSTHLASLR